MLNKWRKKRAERRMFKSMSRDEVFSWIYQTNKWGSDETPSGKGSELGRTVGIRAQLTEIMRDLEIESMLDLPCGDLNWIKELELPVHYIGADIVPEVIQRNRELYPAMEFAVIDACVDPLPEIDLILMRDLLVHLCFADIELVVANIRKSNAKYLACSTYPNIEKNKESITGKHRRLNMCLAPFSWGPPLRVVDEQDKHGKFLGIWELSKLTNEPAVVEHDE